MKFKIVYLFCLISVLRRKRVPVISESTEKDEICVHYRIDKAGMVNIFTYLLFSAIHFRPTLIEKSSLYFNFWKYLNSGSVYQSVISFKNVTLCIWFDLVNCFRATVLCITLCPLYFCNYTDGKERSGCFAFFVFFWCLVIVGWLFLTMPQVCLHFGIVVFPDHTHLPFYYMLHTLCV